MLMFFQHYYPGKHQSLPPLMVGSKNLTFTTLPSVAKKGLVPLLLRNKGVTTHP